MKIKSTKRAVDNSFGDYFPRNFIDFTIMMTMDTIKKMAEKSMVAPSVSIPPPTPKLPPRPSENVKNRIIAIETER